MTCSKCPLTRSLPSWDAPAEAARPLASRARRRVHRGTETVPEADLSSKREIVDAFLAALRAGDFEGLIAVLDPDVIVRIDAAAATPGTPSEIRGARNWARGAIAFSRLTRLVEPALVNGSPGPRLCAGWAIVQGAKLRDRREEDRRGRDNTNPERLRQLNLSVLDVGTNSGR